MKARRDKAQFPSHATVWHPPGNRDVASVTFFTDGITVSAMAWCNHYVSYQEDTERYQWTFDRSPTQTADSILQLIAAVTSSGQHCQRCRNPAQFQGPRATGKLNADADAIVAGDWKARVPGEPLADLLVAARRYENFLTPLGVMSPTFDVKPVCIYRNQLRVPVRGLHIDTLASYYVVPSLGKEASGWWLESPRLTETARNGTNPKR
ncbi:hypothetical protein CPAR01_03870 [Colletotrichum paranaense]|uniref:Uncharacterized protein n=1 Tax=Colletotrichum paranaense TaxID=1914294 RepID=A0ABQ9SUP6_9PEZI|nr:uncharacterized protein CPAR01_03870 [Colletotrichum paranaense]KAK1543237.1 hypothetical protein CPAR01_03870 [Colletotrichum paranaense]